MVQNNAGQERDFLQSWDPQWTRNAAGLFAKQYSEMVPVQFFIVLFFDFYFEVMLDS